jgi:hypothetical protein
MLLGTFGQVFFRASLTLLQGGTNKECLKYVHPS